MPLSVAFVAFVLRWVADSTCSPYSSVCRKGSDFLSHVYAVVFCFLLIVGITKGHQLKQFFDKLRTALSVMSSDVKQKKD